MKIKCSLKLLKVCRAIVCVTVIAGIASAIPFVSNAVVQTTSCEIDGVLQRRNDWCWAACAEICGKTSNEDSDRTQADVVAYICGDAEVQWGSISDASDGATYVAYGYDLWQSTSSTKSFSAITQYIAAGHPVATGINDDGDHMVVVYITQYIDNSSGVFYYLDYYDPYNGRTIHITYDDFCDELEYCATAYCS